MANNDKRYEKPEKGEAALVSTRDTWTIQLGDRSVAACYAVIGAAWAIYGNKISTHMLAFWAVGVAIFQLFLSVAILWLITELLTCRYDYSQRHPELWKKEWEDSANPTSFWPYTEAIQRISDWYHRFKFLLPIVSGLLLILSFIYSPPLVELSPVK